MQTKRPASLKTLWKKTAIKKTATIVWSSAARLKSSGLRRTGLE